MKAILMLEDGKSFAAETSGPKFEAVGEVIMNTAVVGYQELMTDPANAGKILVLTYPLIGNYGCALKFSESEKVWLTGLVVKEKSRIFSNWQATMSLDDFIKKYNLPCLSSVDTRTLAVYLRQKGQMLGIISSSSFDKAELLEKIRHFKKNGQSQVISKVSTSKVRRIGKNPRKNIAILDLGITNSIVRQLEALGFSLTIFPHNAGPKEIINSKAHGLVISGGPEELTVLSAVAENIRTLLGKLPVLGIGSGNLVLGIAFGAKIDKLKIGHRGVNYPVQYSGSFKGEITTQNHSFAVDGATLMQSKDVKITGYNLNDRTVEEIESRKLKVLGVQYNPVSPGNGEINSVLKKFVKMLKRS